MSTSAEHADHPERPDNRQTDETQLIMVVRAAEKPNHNGSPHGVTADGEFDRYSLTVNGWIRAGALIGLFAPSREEPPEGLRRPDTVYASAYEEGHSKRAVQTVTPLAARLGLEVVRRYAAGDEGHLVKELSSRPGAAVVSWSHEAIHKLVEHLGDVTPLPPAHWPSDRYDIVWTFTRTGTGWTFAQVPQMLLPGDLPYPIAG